MMNFNLWVNKAVQPTNACLCILIYRKKYFWHWRNYTLSVALFLAGTDEQYGAALMRRVHINPECDVLHVCITHCLIPALGLVWSVAVHLCGRQQNSRTESDSETKAKGRDWSPVSLCCSVSCQLLASMLMDKRVLLNKRRDWSFVSVLVIGWVEWDAYSRPAKAPTVCWHHPLLIVIEDQFTQ